MRVISASQFGTPDVLRVEERDTPHPANGEVIVEVRAAGINLMDSYVRRGMIESFQPPLELGVEGAGVVIEADPRAAAKVGDRVAWQGVPGSYAERLAVPSARLVAIPPSVSFEAAAGGLMQGLTAQHLCYDSVPVPAGATVVVHSAASGVGRVLTQLVTNRGGRVIATVSRAHKAPAAAAAGAANVIVRDETDDLHTAILDVAGGTGVDFVFDGSGRALFGVSISVLRFRGVFVHYGRAGGDIPPINLRDQPDGIHLVHCRGDAAHETADEWRQRASQVMDWIADGTLDVLIDRTYPLEDAATAHGDLESQETVGKLLLIP